MPFLQTQRRSYINTEEVTRKFIETALSAGTHWKVAHCANTSDMESIMDGTIVREYACVAGVPPGQPC